LTLAGPILPSPLHTGHAFSIRVSPAGSWGGVEICARLYRPRRARESPLFRLVEQHLEELLRVYPARFAKAHGPLRPVVERVLRGFLTCGLVEHGFARLWCGTCRTSVLCRFSCRGRSFCPSCEKKKQLLWAEWLQKEVLAPVPHRHVVFTMPRLLRPLLARSGIVASIATSGDLMQWHPHGHLLATDGAFSEDGAFHTMASWNAEAVMTLFRERLLARLTLRHAISEDLARRLLSWRLPGFSAHVGAAIPFEDKKAIEDVACYLVRAPLSLKKLVYLDGQKAVLYRSKMNPFLGRNFEAMDPLEWLARLADHIPDAGKHRTHFYAYYANRVRGQRSPEDSAGPTDETEAPKKRSCTPSWARLISKVYQADSLVCQKCGGPLKIVAYVTDELSITRILDHLGLSPPRQDKPPPTGELVRVPVDDERREIEAY